MSTEGAPSSPKRARSASGKRAKAPGLLTKLQGGYMELVRAIVRPPRAEYVLDDLGPQIFKLRGKMYERTDLEIVNQRGQKLVCSWWQPVAAERVAKELPCVVYMHGNSSCRIEALENLPLVLSGGCTLFALDFAGCGHSDGEYITLGYNERDDLKAAVSHLRGTGHVSTVALWGRSMGAATALLHGPRDPSIAAMVLDSPFSSLERLCWEIVDQVNIRHKPRFIVSAGLRVMRRSVMKMTGMDILRLKPIERADSCFIPTVFVAGREDQFIPPCHTQDIYDRYAGEKNMVLVDGGHNSKRPTYFMDSVTIFFYNRLCVPAGLTEEQLGMQPANLFREGSLLSSLVASVTGAQSPRVEHRQTQAAEQQASERRSWFQRKNARAEMGYPDAHAGADDERKPLSREGNGATAAGVPQQQTSPLRDLVACATSAKQSTLPSRQRVQEALK